MVCSVTHLFQDPSYPALNPLFYAGFLYVGVQTLGAKAPSDVQ